MKTVYLTAFLAFIIVLLFEEGDKTIEKLLLLKKLKICVALLLTNLGGSLKEYSRSCSKMVKGSPCNMRCRAWHCSRRYTGCCGQYCLAGYSKSKCRRISSSSSSKDSSSSKVSSWSFRDSSSSSKDSSWSDSSGSYIKIG